MNMCLRIGSRLALVCVLILACATAARGAGAGAALKAGTTGLGGELTVGLSPKVNLRAGANWLSLSFKPDSDDDDGDEEENITLEIDLRSALLTADWHPAAGNFRISAGLALNDNKGSLRYEPGDIVEVNDRDYRISDFAMNLDFDRLAPYFGIGYGNAARDGRRVVFTCDFGVMYHGTPRLTARATAANPLLQPFLDRDLEEELRDLNDDIKPFRFYPVLTAGLAFRF